MTFEVSKAISIYYSVRGIELLQNYIYYIILFYYIIILLYYIILNYIYIYVF
jgi:hypothetical protein